MSNNPLGTTGDQIHHAVGKAISEYAQVEFALASILGNLLRVDFAKAYMIFFAVQNVRARHELFESLLAIQFKAGISKYWDSCSKMLQTLALFRNALAHWHSSPTLVLAREPDQGHIEYKLSHPVPGNFAEIEMSDIELFRTDCRSIRTALTDLAKLAKRRPATLPKRFRQPITYRNQASLRPPQTPKAPGLRRKPSVPKLSRAQKRAKALKDARMAKKKS
jgi:hypothetical protein